MRSSAGIEVSASIFGSGSPAGHLFMTHRVSLLIRLHGIRLWLSKLPVQPRPAHTEEAVR